MVLPYPKGFYNKVVVSSILLCGSIVYSVFVVIILVDLFRFLTKGFDNNIVWFLLSCFVDILCIQ